VTETLKSLRRKAGLSQAQLARRCGVRQATLSAIEGGRARPQRTTVAALAAVLGVHVEELARVLRQGGAGASSVARRKAGAAADGLGLGDWPFLTGLDADLRAGLATALVAQWSHLSTALEGNTISAGDTVFVLTQGLTVSGKTLREHQELEGEGREDKARCRHASLSDMRELRLLFPRNAPDIALFQRGKQGPHRCRDRRGPSLKRICARRGRNGNPVRRRRSRGQVDRPRSRRPSTGQLRARPR